MLIVKQIFVEGLDKNFSYVLYDDRSLEGAVIDPNGEIERVLSFIEAEKIRVRYLINTHGHRDHIEHNDLIKAKFGVVDLKLFWENSRLSVKCR